MMDSTQKQLRKQQMERFARDRHQPGLSENFSDDDDDEEDMHRPKQTTAPAIQSQVARMRLKSRNECNGSNNQQNNMTNKTSPTGAMAQGNNRAVTGGNQREVGKPDEEFDDFNSDSASEWYEYRKCSIKEARDQRSCQRKSLYDAMQKQKTASHVLSAASRSQDSSPEAAPARKQLQLYSSAMKTVTQQAPDGQVIAAASPQEQVTRNYNPHAAANTVSPQAAFPSFSLSLNKNDRDPLYQTYNQLAESQQTVMQTSAKMAATRKRGQEEGFTVKNNNTAQQQQYYTTQNLQFRGKMKTVNNTSKFNSTVDLNQKSNQQSNQIEAQQYKDVKSYISSLRVPVPKHHPHGRNYNLMNRPKKQDPGQCGVEMEAADSAKPKRFEEIQCFRHSMVTNMQTRNLSMKYKDECSQSTVMDSRTFKISNSYGNMMKSTTLKLNQNNVHSRRTFNTENKYSLGGKSAHSVKVAVNEQDEDDNVDCGLESEHSTEDNKVLVYETKQTSQNESPLRKVEEETPVSQIDYFANKKKWNNLKFYDEQDFDPVHYLSQRIILAKKYNYTVPESFGSSSVVLKYCNDSDALEIYKVDHLVNKSDNDDSKYIVKGGKKLYQLDKLVKSIKMTDVNGFIYGPFSTRFWMMRMGINQLIVNNSWKTVTGKDKADVGSEKKSKRQGGQQEQQDQQNSQQTRRQSQSKQLTQEQMKKYNEWQNCLPFYAWNCITLQMDDRDIDLIFFDDQSVKIFILFLIMKLDTYNGIRNSLESLRRQKIIRPRIPTKVMMQKIFFNFFIMKIRMKMSFEACVQHRTLKELWLLAILKSYEQRNRLGLIEKPFPKITRRMLHRIRNLCFKGLTENSLEEEKKLNQKKQELQKQTLIKKKKQGEKQEQTLTNFLKKSILSKDDIDDLFEELYQSEDSNHDPLDEKLYVRQTDPTQQEDEETKEALRMAMSNKSACETLMNSEKMQQKTQQFKRRYLRSEKRSLYSKIMLLVNLRVLKGPLYIYALLECVKLNRSILILELELGKEAAIPKEFNIKLYPCCFQYYDCLNEVISKNFSQFQKTRLLSQFQKKYEHQSKIFSSKKNVNVAKQKHVSIGERISRDFKNFFSNDDMRDSKSIRNKEFKCYLSLFNKAENIQNARYIELNKHQLRRTIQMSQQHLMQDETSKLQASQKDNLETQTGLHSLKFSTYENLGKFDNKEKVKDNDLHVDLNYMTQIQVGRKRQDLFVKKVLYQNQLTALKQKGKRLLMCERLDAQSIEQTEEFLDFIEKQKEQNSIQQPKISAQAENEENNMENSLHVSDREMKSFIGYLNNFQQTFQQHSILEQEDTVMRHRAKLIKGILSRRNFQDINNYLDQKIKYDQRFFQKGYAEYQAFMSDIRKQICLNEQILRLRDRLGKLQKTLDAKHQRMYDTLDPNNKMQEIQQQKEMLNHFRNQAEDQYQTINEEINEEQQQNQKNLADKLLFRNYKTIQQCANNDTPDLRKLDEESASKQCMSSFLSQEELNIKNTNNQLSDPNQNMPITDAFESKNHTPIISQNAMRLKKKHSKMRRPMSENGQVGDDGDDVDADSESSCGRVGLNEVLSKVDSSYPSMNCDDDDVGGDSIQQVHENAIATVRQSQNQKEANQIIDQMRQVLKQSKKQKGANSKNQSLFVKLAQAVGNYDAKCPINQEMKQVRSKIVRKRARIHLVQTEGQKSLWGKDASYEPGDIYKYHKRQSNVREQSDDQA